ncbi:MAG: GGDEF domain-containing protein [Aquabacterium sp.]|uniref:GGDEF domain-containing protein n=1 Tax=Aquabacterium sp. TaxID=1872578 RepID=UPI003BE2B42F
MTLHLPTLLLLQITVSLTVGLALLYVLRGPARRSLTPIAWAMLGNAAAYVLFILRDQIPDFLSIVVGNSILAMAVSGILVSLRLFYGQRPRHLPIVGIPLLFLVPGLILLMDDAPNRVILTSSVVLCEHLAILATLFRYGRMQPSRGANLVALGTLVISMGLLVRIDTALTGPARLFTLLTSDWLLIVTFASSFVTLTLYMTGFILMAEERARESTRTLAMEDVLTRLPNRRAILDALRRQLALAERSQHPLTILMLDVDHFKQVNDTYGHLAGDHVLTAVGQTIRERLRTQDLVGRLGGEEFLIVLPNTDEAGGKLLAEALREAIAEHNIHHDGEDIGVRVSIGMYCHHPAGQSEPQDLIRAADAALYSAKSMGRDQVVMATPMSAH